jgi:hypothetical protein
LPRWKPPPEDAGAKSPTRAPISGCARRPLLSDYTWNHTTLWAMKADDAYTYLQCGFDPDTVREQLRRLKEALRQEILFHMEFMKNGDGRVIPGAIPLVYYTTEERLERDDRFLPRDRRVRGQSAREQRRGRRALSRGQRAAARQAALRSEGPAESRQDGSRFIRKSGNGEPPRNEDLDSGRAQLRLFNWKQVDALPRESTLLVLPTAAIEQHGHHLPLATDTLINNLLLGHALGKLPADLPVYALPPVHTARATSTSASPERFR